MYNTFLDQYVLDHHFKLLLLLLLVSFFLLAFSLVMLSCLFPIYKLFTYRK